MNLQKIYLVVAVCFLASCTRTPGEGGRASITGKVELIRMVQLNNPSSIIDTIAASDEDVYIIYGDNTSPDDRVQTNPDGEFAFNWLRSGDYTIYVYSEDTANTNTPLPQVAFSTTATIEDRDEVVTLDPLRIFDKN